MTEKTLPTADLLLRLMGINDWTLGYLCRQFRLTKATTKDLKVIGVLALVKKWDSGDKELFIRHEHTFALEMIQRISQKYE